MIKTCKVNESGWKINCVNKCHYALIAVGFLGMLTIGFGFCFVFFPVAFKIIIIMIKASKVFFGLSA